MQPVRTFWSGSVIQKVVKLLNIHTSKAPSIFRMRSRVHPHNLSQGRFSLKPNSRHTFFYVLRKSYHFLSGFHLLVTPLERESFLSWNAWGVVVIRTRTRTPLLGYFAICIPDELFFSSSSVDASRADRNPLQVWRILLVVYTKSISPYPCPSDNPIIYGFSFIVSPGNKDR